MAQFVKPLAALNKEWGDVTMRIGMKAMGNADEAGAAAVDYMMYSGYVTLAYLWAWMAQVAQAKLAAGEGDAELSTKQKFKQLNSTLQKFCHVPKVILK
jgi:hypothetical protein